MKKTLSTFIASSVLGATFSVLPSLTESAAAAYLTFDANDDQGSEAVSVGVLAQDVAGGIKFTLTVNDPINTGDILAAYVDFNTNLKNLDVLGAFNDRWRTNTRNVAGGNIGERFDLGVQLTDTGSSGGLTTTAMFTVLADDLDVSDLFGEAFAVRLQSVGLNPNGGGGSAKQFGIVPTTSIPGDPGQPVPEPLTILGAGTALGFGASFKHKLAQAKRKSQQNT